MHIEDVLDGRYRLEERLTDTDTGVIYRAKDLHDDVDVAVKVVPRALLIEGASLAGYRQEVRIATELRHPNLVPVLRVGETGGTHYTVMPIVVGESLRSTVGVTMVPRQVVHIVRQLLEVLQLAHQAGLVHGALGPDSILLARNSGGRALPKITGFGAHALRPHLRASRDSTAAMLELEGSLVDFTAPEQFHSDTIDGRADLYSLGVLTYSLLTGVTPFAGTDRQAQPISKRAPYLDIDPLLEAFAMWLMQPSPAKRPATAADAAHVLDMIRTDRRAAAAALGAVDNQMTMRLELIAAPIAPTARAASETGDTGYEQLPKRRSNAKPHIPARFSQLALGLAVILAVAWQSPALLRSAHAEGYTADDVTTVGTISRHIAVGIMVETSAQENDAPEVAELVEKYRALQLYDFLGTEVDRVYIVGVLDDMGRQVRRREP